MLPHPAFLRQRETAAYLHRRGQPVPFAELRRYLLHDSPARDYSHGYSRRTLQRDIPLIAENFGYVIRSQRHAGYYVAEVQAMPASQQRLHEAFELHRFFRLPATLAPHVQPEPRQPLGLQHLRPLLQAAQTQQVVDLDYQAHWADAPSRRTCGPLLLREFRGRWYVLAVMEGSNYLVCFGLDRIQALSPTGRPFTPPADFDPATHFAHCFGITRPTDGQLPEEIRLRFAPVQGRYALSFPLHASQQLLAEAADGILLTLTVYDTHDLRMELLSYGPAVEVLAPLALREWLYAQHHAAAHRLPAG